jgi:rod shape-determining protein MreC
VKSNASKNSCVYPSSPTTALKAHALSVAALARGGSGSPSAKAPRTASRKTAEVGLYTSEVDLISTPGLRLAATLEGDTRPINYQGASKEAFGPFGGIIDFVPLDVFANSATPRRVVTSGLGGTFPSGLVIGKITNLESGTDGLFKSGKVELDPRLVDVSEVTVLVPLKTP